MINRPWVCQLAAAALLAACASAPETPQAPPSVAKAGQAPPQETQAAQDAFLEKKFQEAVRGYRLVEKDGKTLYCKREKVIGSTIPTLQCMTEAQLRLQVENTEQVRDRMRNSTHCTLGHSGGGGGCGGS